METYFESMIRFLITFVIGGLIMMSSSVIAQKPADPTYRKTFGDGVIVISDKGLPERSKFDASMYDYRNGIWYVKSGAESQVNLRIFLPKGRNISSYIKELKKAKPDNLKYHTGDLLIIRMFRSHDHMGNDLVKAGGYSWPNTVSDIPKWEQESFEVMMNVNETSTDTEPGADWPDNLRSKLYGVMIFTQPGQKIYFMVQFAYEYKTPAGEIETKWDAQLNKWVQVKSNGMLGYVYSDPVVSATLEFK